MKKLFILLLMSTAMYAQEVDHPVHDGCDDWPCDHPVFGCGCDDTPAASLGNIWWGIGALAIFGLYRLRITRNNQNT